jgi:alpha-L-fucosidase 2
MVSNGRVPLYCTLIPPAVNGAQPETGYGVVRTGKPGAAVGKETIMTAPEHTGNAPPATSDRIPEPAQWTLRYTRPADAWEEALPLGNGYMGAMVFGAPEREHVQFNEDTVWTGRPHDYARDGAVQVLPEIRRLLAEGRQKDAEQLAMDRFMSVPLNQKTFQPCGDLRIAFHTGGEYRDYERTLDLQTGMHRVSYRVGDATYIRETFASYPDRAVVMRSTVIGPGSITADIYLDSPHPDSRSTARSDGSILLEGRVEDHGVAFAAVAALRNHGGELHIGSDSIAIRNAQTITILLTAASNVVDWQTLGAHPAERCENVLAGMCDMTCDDLLDRHTADMRSLFDRFSLDLGHTPASSLPTSERIAAFDNGNDPHLAALVCQYGRYLLLACSRPGSQPANLQGVWNDSLDPPWGSKYTCNINTEMNYWPAEVTGLSECNQPLFTALAELQQSGRRTAREHYGADGWVLHHNFDLWRGTAPINHANHGIWVTGGAWLALHMWEHWLFSMDRDFLRETAFPIMRGAAQFFTQFLSRDETTGWLISTPSNSPEQGGLVAGPTMDHQIIRSLFFACVEAADLLDHDDDLCNSLKTMIPRIAPNHIGEHGQLQEWLDDVDDPDNQHRHVSHLWGVYPGAEINWLHTPELWRAARQSLLFRGDGATGWSMGWKVNLWARFLEGNHAYKILGNLLAPVGTHGQGGMYPNLFDAHPPFQIDGNFGAAAGIAEMLIQSHVRIENDLHDSDFLLHLLPALPDAWPDGSVRGLRARGGRTVDIQWRNRTLTRATVNAQKPGKIPLRYGDATVWVDVPDDRCLCITPDVFRKKTQE